MPADPRGLARLPDFPNDAYARLNRQVAPWQPRVPDLYAEYAGGWNALAYRFRYAAECSDSFGSSLSRAGNSPAAHERYIQERDLFGFFVAALSTLECAGYAAYAMAGMVDSASFPLGTDEQKREATLKRTRERYFSRFPTDQLTALFAALTTSAEFVELEYVRNVLAHRAAPPRRFYRGGDRDGEADWATFAFAIDQRTTARRRVWLSNTLEVVLNTAVLFAIAHL